jgi:beta-lactamase superfamily II metal-dependent hydrolase
MATLHFLNVAQGDCTLIQHNSGRNTLIDICKGNYEPPAKPQTVEAMLDEALDKAWAKIKGNFGMSKKPTNPISYLSQAGVDSIFRFILTHPDMDHLDGFDSLMNEFSVTNFWDSGVRRTKPDFEDCPQYEEEDWDRYASVYGGAEQGIKVITPLAGSRFKYANLVDEGEDGPDGLSILAPDPKLVDAANNNGDVNDASYVILYRSAGGRILIPWGRA